VKIRIDSRSSAFLPALALLIIATGLAGAQTGSQTGGTPGPIQQGITDQEPLGPPHPTQLEKPLLEGPVDPSTYLLGPGDILGLTLQGTIQRFEKLAVTPEGMILIPGAGRVSVAGISLEKAREEIVAEVGRAYRNVRIMITLLQLRRFVISVLGQVQNPGQYYVSQTERVSEAINMAGGAMPNASQRSIRLIRRDGSSSPCDLLRFWRTGDLDANPNLRDGDIVMVDFRREGVLLNGDVYKPGEIEYIDSDSLGGLIRIAGGLTQSAILDTVEIARYLPGSVVPGLFYLTRDHPGDEDRILSFPLQPRDVILIRTDPDWDIRYTVEIRGEVRYPGVYVVDEDKTLLTDIIERAGGFTPEASLREASLVRRIDESIKDAEYERLLLVPPADMNRTEYEYFKMRGRQRLGLMAVDFFKLFVGEDRSQDVILRAGDVIDVPPQKTYVTLAGQVAIPGNIRFEPGLNVKDYITRGGGYAWKASKGKTVVIRAATGEWVSKGDIDEIGPGDTIWVPEKPERDWFSVFKDSIVILSQLATIWLVVKTSTD
jgi:protein involved in polysaccharide export with SLBB domain